MAVQIVKDDERKIFEFSGGEFYYRRQPLKMKAKWTNECTNRWGVIDFYGLIQKALPYCLLGWKPGAVIDENGNEILFSEENIFSMPEDFYTAFGAVLGISQPESITKEKGEEGKNSKSTSSSK